MMRWSFNHEVRVYVSNGTVAHFTLHEIHQLYRSWQLWLLITVGFFIMSTGHPITLPQFDSVELRLVFYIVALLFYMAALDIYSKVANALWHRFFRGPIPLVLLSTPLLLGATYAACALLVVIFEPERATLDIMTWQMNLRNIVVAHVFETVALLWLLPAQRARQDGLENLRKVTLAGRSFVLNEIERVKAAEHYLEVYGAFGLEIIRERMSTFLDQVKEDDGIQTHRSHWVSRKSAEGYVGGTVRLPCGGNVPVARGRQQAVRDWLEPGRNGHDAV